MTEKDERARNESGEYVQEHTEEAVLEVMKPLEPYMTAEIADELGWSRRSAYNVLSRLHKSDEIRKKKPEARRVIWIRTE
ncbi:hypothetical protein [Haladaptatus halobius]|uniref:hypothetical protein n=1 Tax=Haladaptatus halobius TaxID=2884875 RepID=UPI001D0A7841|nr:hypothetical protein [Haladaptatus halobius]